MIERRYYDENVWERITEDKARDRILRFYLDWELILEELMSGYIVRTDVAEYRIPNRQNDEQLKPA